MNYKTDLIKKISNSTNWPDFERANFLDELDEICNQAFDKGTIEGYLASLLIYQQLSEEIIKQLLKDAQFFIQLSVFPAEIQFLEKQRLTFGQVIDEFKTTISFQNKNEIISACQELNKHRIEFVHGLTKRTSLKDIGQQVSKVRDLYIEIYKLSTQAHDNFRLSFKDFKKDIDWNDYLNE